MSTINNCDRRLAVVVSIHHQHVSWSFRKVCTVLIISQVIANLRSYTFFQANPKGLSPCLNAILKMPNIISICNLLNDNRNKIDLESQVITILIYYIHIMYYLNPVAVLIRNIPYYCYLYFQNLSYNLFYREHYLYQWFGIMKSVNLIPIRLINLEKNAL